MKLSHTIPTIIIILCLLFSTDAQFTFQQSLNFANTKVFQYVQCGYNSYPIISLTNSSLLYWSFQLRNLSKIASVRCFKNNQQINQQYRYVIAFFEQQKISDHTYFLFKQKQKQLVPVIWRPFAQTDIIQDARISANIIAVKILTQQAKTSVKIFNITNLQLITSIPYNTADKFVMEIDNFDNLISFYPVTEDLRIIYGEQYRYFQILPMRQLNIPFLNIKNIGIYANQKTTSKFVVNYYQSLTNSAKRYFTIKSINNSYQQISKQISLSASKSIQVHIEQSQKFEQFTKQIYCGDKIYHQSLGDKCLKYQTSCIIQKIPLQGICIPASKGSNDKDKLILLFSEQSKQVGFQESIEIYLEEDSNRTLLIIVISSFIGLLFITIILYALYRKGVICKKKGGDYKRMDQREKQSVATS